MASLHVVSCSDKNPRQGYENQQNDKVMSDMPPYTVITKPAKIEVSIEFERPFSATSCTIRIILHNRGDKPYFAFEDNGVIEIDAVVGRFNGPNKDHLTNGVLSEVNPWHSKRETVAIPVGESKTWRINLAQELPLKVGDNFVSLRLSVGNEEQGPEPVLVEGIYLEVLELLEAF